MRDPHRDLKNTLVNFVDELRRVGIPAGDDVQVRAFVDAFVESQFPGSSRPIPCCPHCGSDNVIEGDLADEIHLDPVTEKWERKSSAGVAGPSWVCQEADCGTHSPRST